MVEERNATEARQGESGNRILIVLAVSLSLAAVLAIVAYLWVFAVPNEELTAPIPSSNVETQNPAQTENPTPAPAAQ